MFPHNSTTVTWHIISLQVHTPSKVLLLEICVFFNILTRIIDLLLFNSAWVNANFFIPLIIFPPPYPMNMSSLNAFLSQMSLCSSFTGNYSVLGVRFVFTRRIGHYLTRVYFPAILIVLMSWLSFFVDRSSVPARVSLGITTVLTMTTLLIGIGQGSLPVVSYVKAVDVYLIVCYTLVFGAFAEYALMNYIETTSNRHKQLGSSHEMVSFCICWREWKIVIMYEKGSHNVRSRFPIWREYLCSIPRAVKKHTFASSPVFTKYKVRGWKIELEFLSIQ